MQLHNVILGVLLEEKSVTIEEKHARAKKKKKNLNVEKKLQPQENGQEK